MKKKQTKKIDKEELDNIEKAIDAMLTEKTHSKEYDEMFATYKDKLGSIHDGCISCPWDFAFSLNYFVTCLRFMRDYYKLGENVWGLDRRYEDPKKYKNVPTRLETLEKTLWYYDKWHSLEEEYVTIVHHPETFKTTDNEDGTVTINDFGMHCEYKYGSAKRTYKKLYKDQQKLKKKFFSMLYKYIETWWD